MGVKTEVYKLLDQTERLCTDCPDAKPLADMLREMRARLDAPLRVAVAGMIKAGKSTFLNALIGAEILCTDTLEATYTVCWFQYGERPELTVHFRDGTELQEEAFEKLEYWSSRAYAEQNEKLRDVVYIIIRYPSPVLKSIELIDTPGLNSVYGTDSQNTLSFLALKSSEDTLTEAGKADAILYAFAHTARSVDQTALKAFQDGGVAMSPINAIGILTRTDGTGGWSVLGEATPVEAAGGVITRLREDESLKRLLFTVLPVCAKACEGCLKLAARDWETLRRFSHADASLLRELLFDAEEFCTSTDEEFNALGTPEERSRVFSCLSQYGIIETVQQLRAGKTPEEIPAILQERCGIEAVKEFVLRHFGNRRFLIKSQYILSHLRAFARQLLRSPKSSAQLREVCRQLIEEIGELMLSVQTFRELKALQLYYSNPAVLADEAEREDVLHITGEHGRSVEARLNISGCMTVEGLARTAQRKATEWRAKMSEFMRESDFLEIASIVSRSYEQIYYYLSVLEEE